MINAYNGYINIYIYKDIDKIDISLFLEIYIFLFLFFIQYNPHKFCNLFFC